MANPLRWLTGQKRQEIRIAVEKSMTYSESSKRRRETAPTKQEKGGKKK